MSKAKPIELVTGHRTKEEIENRKEQQEKLKGNNDKIEPTQELNKEEIEIFDHIKNEMNESEILNNLDSYWITEFAKAQGELKDLNKKVKKNPTIRFNKDFRSSRKLAFDIFTKCSDKLCLSPEARAKLSNINAAAQQEKEDPIIKALRDN